MMLIDKLLSLRPVAILRAMEDTDDCNLVGSPIDLINDDVGRTDHDHS